MKRIFKYAVFGGSDIITVPVGAKILHWEVQNDVVHFWAEVDTNDVTQTMVLRQFITIGTGTHYNPDDHEHRFTYLDADGIHVWHVMEVFS